MWIGITIILIFCFGLWSRCYRPWWFVDGGNVNIKGKRKRDYEKQIIIYKCIDCELSMSKLQYLERQFEYCPNCNLQVDLFKLTKI